MLNQPKIKDSEGFFIRIRSRMMKISLFLKLSIMKVCFSFAIFIYIVVQPSHASASFFSDLIAKIIGPQTQASEPAPPAEDTIHNSQNVPLLESSVNPDLKNIKDDPIVPTISPSDPVVLSSSGALGIDSDLEKYASTTKISTYTVKKGDTLEGISKELNVPKSTIVASNADLKKSDLLKIGQTLVIIALKSDKGADLPVKKEDKVLAKAKEDKVAPAEVAPKKAESPKPDEPKEPEPAPVVNNIVPNTQTEVQVVPPPVQIIQPPVEQSPLQPETNTQTPPPTPDTGQPAGTINGGYIWPFPAGVGRVSQGLHADNAYDFSAPKNTPIFAIQSGTVLIVHPTGYNGGYGKYIVINFDDGRQAIFGHMNKTAVEAGQVVKQGDIIGYVGSTGHSTGFHTHIGFHYEGDPEKYGNPYKGLKVNSTDLIEND